MIKLGIIGTGRAGLIHARNFSGGIPGTRLTAVADPDDANRKAALDELAIPKAYRDSAELLNDPDVDAVVVVTPTALHRDIVVAAAEAGKHILCEKPMAMTPAECRDMIAATEKAGVKLQMAFMRRFDKGFRFAKERIEAGEIGDVVLVKSHTRGPSKPRPWMYDIAISNGPLAEVSSHDIDALHWYAGGYIEEVYAIGGNYRNPEAAKEYPDFYDNVALVCRFENGRQGMLDGAQRVEYGYDSRVEILGTRGVIRVGTLDDRAVATCSGGTTRTPTVESWRSLFLDAYREEDLAFARAISEDLPPLVGGMDGLEAVKAVKAGNLSIKERRPVKLTEVER